MEQSARYWKITMVRGHAGKGNFNNLITFYFIAKNIMEAITMAKKMPGVKHRLPPRVACEISYEEYCAGRVESAYCRDGMEMLCRERRRA